MWETMYKKSKEILIQRSLTSIEPFYRISKTKTLNDAEMSIAALPLPRWWQRQFIFHYRRSAARHRQLPKKRKFKKLVNLHKIFILKNATL